MFFAPLCEQIEKCYTSLSDVAIPRSLQVRAMTDFVPKDSIVRTIWGNSDTILIIFAGSAAEFALNRAVDWLFFTGKLPSDPVGRFFSTVSYTQHLFFADEETARQAIGRIRSIHTSIERQRQQQMPDWANRDVLYMLLDYTERAYHLLERPLTAVEQEDLYAVMRRVGTGLEIPDLPDTYTEWKIDRQKHLERDLVRSHYTDALYRRYREQLGWWRYEIMLGIQALLVPPHVRDVLDLRRTPPGAAVQLYRFLRRRGLSPYLQQLTVPREHLAAIRALDRQAQPATPHKPEPRQASL